MKSALCAGLGGRPRKSDVFCGGHDQNPLCGIANRFSKKGITIIHHPQEKMFPPAPVRQNLHKSAPWVVQSPKKKSGNIATNGTSKRQVSVFF